MNNISTFSVTNGILGRTNGILEKEIAKLPVHSHLCLIYRGQEEQFASVLPYLRAGLEGNEKCVYIADDNTAEFVFHRMRSAGLDVSQALRRGSLAILSKQESYLKSGAFDPGQMIHFLDDAVSQAKSEGFDGLRVTGEMTWVLGGDPGANRLIEYESRLNDFIRTRDVIALCQYNRERFGSDILGAVLRTHPIVIVDNEVCDNFFYAPALDYRLIEKDDGEHLEAKLNELVSNKRALAREREEKIRD